MLGQFKGSIEKVAAEIKQIVANVSDHSAEFQCVTFSGKEMPKPWNAHQLQDALRNYEIDGGYDQRLFESSEIT